MDPAVTSVTTRPAPASDHVENLAARLQTTIGANVRVLRVQEGLTQGELAERAGITQQALSRLELGRLNITMRTLVRLAVAMGAEVQDMLEGC